MIAAAQALPASAKSIANGAAHPTHIQERTTMLEGLGDHRQQPVDPAVRLAGDSAIADARPMAGRYPPAQAACGIRRISVYSTS
jgi:hypothetical protein